MVDISIQANIYHNLKTMNKRILIVDDEEDFCEILQFNLESEGYNIDIAYSAEDALKLNLEQFDLILLDVMMGGISGFQMANKIRKEHKLTTPIIFLTAKTTENDTLTGFNLGADDYISKPFSIKEVIARVKAVLLRTTNVKLPEQSESNKIVIDGLQIDLEMKSVIVDNKPVDFTKKEFEILVLLIKHEGRIYSRQEILSKIWASDVIVIDRTIDVNVARIRKKIGPYGKMLKSRSGYGYCFDQESK